ncbi:MAG: hypothetical protein R3F62_11580 [Planctomycetota bacterium]
MYTARAGEQVGHGGGAELAPELAGADGQQDLFVYRVGAFSLARGARASVPLWDQDVATATSTPWTCRSRATRARGAGR